MRVFRILGKDLQMGPRSPLLLWALVLPVVLTLLIRGVFGSLFEPEPRLGIVDEGRSELTEAALELEGVEVTVVDSEDDLRRMVEDNDLDAGLVLPAGFDTSVRAGDQPDLAFFVGGESLASNRIILGVTAIDLVRDVRGEPPPVDVEVVTLGEGGIELSLRLLPMLVIMAVAIAGTMVPAASIVQEKERRTLEAVLVTPVSASEFLLAKGMLGFVLAMLTGVMTLVLNDAFGNDPVALLVALAVGTVMMVEIGLILGSWAPDTNTLFTTWKAGGILLLFPVMFYVWPDLPQWIARIGPTYWFLQPIWVVAAEGRGLGDVWVELLVAVVICVALVPLVRLAGRRMERRLAGGVPGGVASAGSATDGSASAGVEDHVDSLR